MVYGDVTDLTRKTAPDKILHYKHLILLKVPNMMDNKVDLLKWFTNFLIKKASGSGIKNENISLKELAE